MIEKISNNSVSPTQNNESVIRQTKELSKKIETVFLTEMLKIMLADTSFSKDRTLSTYMTVLIPEMAEMFSEREIGLGKFLTENGNIELKQENNTQENTNLRKISLPVTGRLTSAFGLRIDPIDGKLRHHNGVDIALAEGTEIKPVLAGRVIYSGKTSGYGNCVIIEHENRIQTVYAHNSKNLVNAGDTVTENTVIALSGSTGRTTGPHLHFEVRVNGEPVDPLAMVNNLKKSPIF